MQKTIIWAERIFYVILCAAVTARLMPAVFIHPQIAIYLASEFVGLMFIMIQRKGAVQDRPYALLIAFIGTSMPLLVVPDGERFAPEIITATLMLGGAVIALGGKLSLRRSFGLVAANRGVKTEGLYRVVRHPIYFGYITSHTGYLLLYFSVWNAAVFATAWIMLWLRAVEEEKFLMRDERYRQYAGRVRKRLIPCIF